MEKLNQSKMKNQLVHEHTGYVNEAIRDHNEILRALNEIVVDYNKLGFSPLDFLGLKNLVHDTDGFVRKQAANLVGELPSFNGLRMKAEAFLDSLELPNYTSVKAKTIALKLYLKKINRGNLILNNFEISDGVVVINSERLEAELDRHRTYAETEREIEAYEAMKNFFDAYKRLDQVHKKYTGGSIALRWGGHPSRPWVSTEHIFSQDLNTGELKIKEDFFNPFKG